MRTRDHNDKIRNLQDVLKKEKELNYDLTKQYFEYKHAIHVQKQHLKDQMELAKLENDQLKQHLDKTLNDMPEDAVYTQKSLKKKESNFASRFRKQSKENEEDLHIVKVQYEQVQAKYLTDLQQLQKELKEVTEKNKHSRVRRNNEANALHGDVATLRKRVKDMENELKKLKALVDEERTDDLVSYLQNVGNGAEGISE